MIFNKKYVLFTVCFLYSVSLYSQNIKENIVLDINGAPMFEHSEDNTIPYYHTLKGERIPIEELSIGYKYGKDSLNDYIRSGYYNHSDYNWREVNITLYYCILFDNELSIQEIRFYKMGISNELKNILEKEGHLSIIKQVLLESQNKWITKKKCSNKHKLYIGSVKIY